MNQVKKNKQDAPPVNHALSARIREGLFIVLLATALFFVLALVTYHSADPGWTHTAAKTNIHNAGGPIGAWFADVLLSLFGFLAFGFPAMIALGAGYLFLKRHQTEDIFSYSLLGLRLTGFVLAVLSGCALSAIYFADASQSLSYPLGSGGILGLVLSEYFLKTLFLTGATVLLLAAFLTGVTFATGLSWLKLMDLSGRLILRCGQSIAGRVRNIQLKIKTWHLERKQRQLTEAVLQKVEPKISLPKTKPAPEPKEKPESKDEPGPFGFQVKRIKKKNTLANQVPLFTAGPDGPMPSLSLLDVPSHTEEAVYTDQALREMSRQVESKLSDFGVDVEVVAVHPGPVVTRFELQLAAGVKASKITGLARDLARSLAVVSVRVVEIIPGKPYVGLELPNAHRQVVCLSELLSSDVYQKNPSSLTLALGKDIAGHPSCIDLGKMPHLLVAGTTGAGKSVGLNAMLLSILFKATPDEVRLIMIDPKMLELSVYDNIPHLLAPVVTDMKEAANALRWCVAEMDRRYQLMAALGVRNLSGFNRKVQDAIDRNKPLSDPLFEPMTDHDEAPLLNKLPYIVVVVDEFADMMMVVGKKVEELIARIAQKARAAGIHLILATQRPSVDVITGLIKANVPSRIAFQVATRIDSRTILDQSGAEQLLGRGDMLYLPVGAGIPTRIHGAFVSDQEVHKVVDDWRKRGKPEYVDDIVSGEGLSSPSLTGLVDPEAEDGEADPLYDQAVAVVLESRRASISMVQRRLKVGYNRAARLIEQMEASGLVSSMQANGSREVLVPGNAKEN